MSFNPEFDQQVSQQIQQQGENTKFDEVSHEWLLQSLALKYSYNYQWTDRPIIQYPQDIVQMQELIWQVKPDLIIETGIAHGGSLMLSASMLALLELAEATDSGEILDPTKPKRKVLGIDIDIREHNRQAIQAHPFANRIDMIQGSSIDDSTVEQVKAYASSFNKVMVVLDSNHTHEHVLNELTLYAPFVSTGSYCVVFDTIVSDMPDQLTEGRPWNKDNNPLQAVKTFLKTNSHFKVDTHIDDKLKISAAKSGYLIREK